MFLVDIRGDLGSNSAENYIIDIITLGS